MTECWKGAGTIWRNVVSGQEIEGPRFMRVHQYSCETPMIEQTPMIEPLVR